MNTDLQGRRIRARNLTVLSFFGSALAILALTNPSTDRARPFLIAVGLTMCAKVVVEYLFGLPMRMRVVLQPSERAMRARVLVAALGVAAFLLYLFYFEPWTPGR
jgi:hypothetical protein